MNRTAEPGYGSWTEANQRYLLGELARVRRRLETTGEPPADRPEPPAAMELPPAIDQLVELFGLSAFERDTLLLAAGVEMDSALAATCPRLTFGVAMAVLPDPHWSALTPERPLRRFALVQLDASQGVTAAQLRIDERILHYLAGLNQPDTRLGFLLTPLEPPEWTAGTHDTVATQATAAIVAAPGAAPLVQLCGNDQAGQEDAAALIAASVGHRLFSLRAEDVPPPGAELDGIETLWEREARLLPAALLLQCDHAGLTPGARRLAARATGLLVFVAAREPVETGRPFLRFDIDKPQPAEQRVLWERALGDAAARLDGSLDDLAEQFRLSARTIRWTGALAQAANGGLEPDGLRKLCREVARPSLDNLAQRLTPAARWDDLVLPERQLRVLRHLAAQVRHRLTVYETWGFSARGRRGLGVSALFAGDSGTGKTLAAEILANELALDLYRIDLSAVVSKYIGETEKNLRKVFDTAEESGSILLFDEADALFGKRGEVKDSHDRYANIEVGYLLQRMEAYEGLAILTTNLKTSLDPSFNRRLRFTVQFPFPDLAQREAIWRRVFPPGAPVHELDPAKLARLKVTGGNIQNIALNAAFLSAEDGGQIAMEHLLVAAQLEADKNERPLSDAETRGWS